MGYETLVVGANGRLRDLVLNLAHAELRSRFRATTLGVTWSALNPVLTAVVLYIVFGRVVRLGVENYPLFVLVALVPWGFLSGAATQGAGALLRHRALVQQIRIPREAIVLAVVVANVPALAIGLALVAGLGWVQDASVDVWLGWLPLAIATQLVFVTGVTLLAAVATTLFRDVEHLLAVGLRAGFFLSPNLYPVDRVPEAWRPLYVLNPVSGIVELYRAPLLAGEPPELAYAASAILFSTALLLAGAWLFRRYEADFDDFV